VKVTDAVGRELTVANVSASGEQAMPPLNTLTSEVGWLLVAAGVIGVIAPGIPGTPFLIVGVLVITPGGAKWLSRWTGDKSPRIVKAGMKQIGRFLDDLERAYPRLP
jgi:hypothetical protein